MIKIVADRHIPHVEDLFSGWGELICLPTGQIVPENINDADILIIRSVTNIDYKLLKSSSVRFVGTATAGTEHLDTDWLEQQNIQWSASPGCNAQAVTDYILCCIAYLLTTEQLTSNGAAGIIGVGEVGSRVSTLLQQLGYEVICHDPPRADRENTFSSTPLSQFSNLDIICCHPSLTRSGPHPSFHMLDKTFFTRQKNGCVLINASRGSVINSKDLLNYGKHLTWCLDVFEHEPSISNEILQHCNIATPHIAGYTQLAKWRAIKYIHDKACEFFQKNPSELVAPASSIPIHIYNNDWEQAALSVYNPTKTTDELKNIKENIADHFTSIRNTFTYRDEMDIQK